MAVTFSLVKRHSTPGDDESLKRWYAQTNSINTLGFDAICEEATSGCSATKGDIALVLDSAISVMVRHLAQGEIVQLGDFGKFRMAIINAKPYYDYQRMQKIIPAPINRGDFNVEKNIISSHIRFTPGRSLRNMCKTTSYREVEGGTPE